MEKYCLNDVLVLGQALIRLSEINELTYGFPVLKHKNILSTSSTASNAFYYCYYD